MLVASFDSAIGGSVFNCPQAVLCRRKGNEMTKEEISLELASLAREVGATACQVRQAARAKLGQDLEYPLVVYGPHGIAMRICSSMGTIWVPVPEAWMKT